MAIITFTSDFGYRDHYVAAVKAKVLSINQNIKIVDITHQIMAFDLAHCAYVLRSVFRDFPKGTVHLVSVNAPIGVADKMVALKLEEHYFVGIDNGIFSLLSDKPPTVVVELNKDANFSPAFPERTVLATTAVSLASGISIYNLGKQVQDLKQMLNRQLRVTKSQMSGHVVHIDHYGNLVTNIDQATFDKIRKDRDYSVTFSRESISNISDTYSSSDNGDIVILFNSSGMLEIAISQGNASELLGLSYDSPVSINFVG